jgi:hypothetical protein
MSSELQALEADAAAWRERTAVLANLLESEKNALAACGLARAARKRARDAEQRSGGPSGGRISPIWPSVAWWQQAGKKQQQTPGLSPVTQYFPLDISLLAKDSILEQFGAPFGEPFAEPGHGINIARAAEGLPAVSETGAGNQSFASPDQAAAAFPAGGGSSTPPLFGETFGGPSATHVGSDPGARVGSDPSARVGSDPNANVGSNPAAGVGSNPAAGVGSNPAAPVGSNPAAGVGSDPRAPLFGVNSAPIGSDPNANVGSDLNAPVGTGG